MDRFAPQKGRFRPFLLCGLSVGPIGPIRPIGLGGGGGFLVRWWAWGNFGSVDKYWGHRNKKHKKQPFADASASHLSLVLWHV